MPEDPPEDPPEVPLPPHDLRAMVHLMRALYRLHHRPNYQRLVEAELPPVARFKPGNESVMMGYDFHLSPEGPRLIEVNTNAGGGLLAYRSYGPEIPTPVESFNSDNCHQVDLLNSFAQEMVLFSAGRVRRPTKIAIFDQEPEKQFLFEEMNILRALLETWGVRAYVVGPEALRMDAEGVFLRHKSGAHSGPGERIDLVYNRHCDFYLQTPELAGLRAAYLAGNVCLTPNPRIYGLLADKRRMILWSDAQTLDALGVDAKDMACIHKMVPPCQLLAQEARAQTWNKRKQWVFKPVTAFGSRGVLLGSSISRKRFDTLDPDTTLLQRHFPPSLTFHPDTKREMKTDFRLFVYRNKILGVTARLYRGQVTNFRQPGSGYAPVRIVSEESGAPRTESS